MLRWPLLLLWALSCSQELGLNVLGLASAAVGTSRDQFEQAQLAQARAAQRVIPSAPPRRSNPVRPVVYPQRGMPVPVPERVPERVMVPERSVTPERVVPISSSQIREAPQSVIVSTAPPTPARTSSQPIFPVNTQPLPPVVPSSASASISSTPSFPGQTPILPGQPGFQAGQVSYLRQASGNPPVGTVGGGTSGQPAFPLPAQTERPSGSTSPQPQFPDLVLLPPQQTSVPQSAFSQPLLPSQPGFPSAPSNPTIRGESTFQEAPRSAQPGFPQPALVPGLASNSTASRAEQPPTATLPRQPQLAQPVSGALPPSSFQQPPSLPLPSQPGFVSSQPPQPGSQPFPYPPLNITRSSTVPLPSSGSPNQPLPPQTNQPLPPSQPLPQTSQPLPPQTSQPFPPQTSQPLPPQTSQPLPPQTTQPLPLQTTQPLPPQSTQPLPPQSGQPLPPQSSQPSFVPPPSPPPVQPLYTPPPTPRSIIPTVPLPPATLIAEGIVSGPQAAAAAAAAASAAAAAAAAAAALADLPPVGVRYDFHGCPLGPDLPYVPRTDMSVWCPSTRQCLSPNQTCPGLPPVFREDAVLSCQADTAKMWSQSGFNGTMPTAPYLPSWSDGPLRTLLVDFVSRVTNPSSDGYIPPNERVAVFDNDGTMVSEHPNLIQVAFLNWFVRRFPDPGQILQNQLNDFLTGKLKGDPMSATLAGLSVDMYTTFLKMFIREATHPVYGVPYTQLAFVPMVELISFMQAACFTVYVMSGGENILMRTLLPSMLGIPPQLIVGAQMEIKYQLNDDNGKYEFKINPRLQLSNDRAMKPVGILRHIGRQPQFATGNSDGDYEMFMYVSDGPGPRLGLMVKHDDAVREVAYDGIMDKIVQTAPSQGWIFASMRRDWKTIFSFSPKLLPYAPSASRA